MISVREMRKKGIKVYETRHKHTFRHLAHLMIMKLANFGSLGSNYLQNPLWYYHSYRVS